MLVVKEFFRCWLGGIAGVNPTVPDDAHV